MAAIENLGRDGGGGHVFGPNGLRLSGEEEEEEDSPEVGIQLRFQIKPADDWTTALRYTVLSVSVYS